MPVVILVVLLLTACGRIGYDALAITVPDGGSFPEDASGTFDATPIPDGSVIPIGDSSYTVAPGYALETVLAAEVTEPVLKDRATALAFPPAGSTFGLQGHIASDVGRDDPSQIHRVDVTAQALELAATGIAQQTVAIQQMAFSPAGSDYGDHLYLCMSTIGRIAPGDSTIQTWRAGHSCAGLDFDYENQLVDSGNLPTLYTNEIISVVYVPPDASDREEVIGGGLPSTIHGYKAYIPQAQAFRGRMFFVTYNTLENGVDGVIRVTSSLEPYVPPTVWLSGLSDPIGAVFSQGAAFGDVMLVAMAFSGEIVAYSADASFAYTLAQGFDQPVAIAWAVENQELWVLERGTGRILRILPL